MEKIGEESLECMEKMPAKVITIHTVVRYNT